MKVSELIAKLQTMSADAEVYTRRVGGSITGVESILQAEEKKVARDGKSFFWIADAQQAQCERDGMEVTSGVVLLK